MCVCVNECKNNVGCLMPNSNLIANATYGPIKKPKCTEKP